MSSGRNLWRREPSGKMHTIAISETARERVRVRVGKLHPFDTIEPRRTALLVIDMQNYFVKPGHQGEVPIARGIVPNINRLGGELRRRGGHVVWIRNGTAGTRQSWSNYPDDAGADAAPLRGDGGRPR